MYYGGEPAAWMTKPAIPEDARYDRMQQAAQAASKPAPGERRGVEGGTLECTRLRRGAVGRAGLGWAGARGGRGAGLAHPGPHQPSTHFSTRPPLLPSPRRPPRGRPSRPGGGAQAACAAGGAPAGQRGGLPDPDREHGRRGRRRLLRTHRRGQAAAAGCGSTRQSRAGQAIERGGSRVYRKAQRRSRTHAGPQRRRVWQVGARCKDRAVCAARGMWGGCLSVGGSVCNSALLKCVPRGRGDAVLFL